MPLSPGEGKGYPLQYSCLRDIMDRGAWQAAVHGVAKSWTQLNTCVSTYHISSVQFSCWVVSDSLRPHESQHARSPCPSPSPGVHSDSRPSSPWCYPAISSSVVPFSPAPNPSQHQSLFQWVNSWSYRQELSHMFFCRPYKPITDKNRWLRPMR